MINQFSIEAFLKQSQSYGSNLLPSQQKSVGAKGGKGKSSQGSKSKFFSSAGGNHHPNGRDLNQTHMNNPVSSYQKMSPTVANNNFTYVDMGAVQSLAK